jgi:vitamin B12 transporter
LEEDLPARLAEMGTRVVTVDAVQIQNAGYLDVGNRFQTLVPGLYAAQKNGPFDYVHVSLQGSRTEDVLWTVDGVRINNRLYAGTTPLDTLPASMIERIDVLEGTQALFYGTQAMAGAINIVTKDFADSADGRVSVGADTNSGRHLDGYFRDRIGAHRFVVYGSADKSEGFQPFRDQDYQPSSFDRNRGYEVLTVGGKYAYDFNNDVRFTLSEQHTDAKLDYAYANTVLQAYNERNEDILSAKLDYRANDRLQFFLKGYYHWWYAYYTEYDNEVDARGALTGNVVVIDNHDFWGFTDYGVNAPRQIHAESGHRHVSRLRLPELHRTRRCACHHTEDRACARNFRRNRNQSRFDARRASRAGFRHNMPSVGPSATVWNVSARWDVMPDFFVKGTVGTAFRLPTAEELFADDPADERGNPDLKPEKSTNVNLSVGGNIGSAGIRWEVVGFARNVENLIGLVDFDATTNQDIFGNLPGTVHVRGAEFILDAPFTPDISSTFSYTYSQSRDSNHRQIRRVPEQLGKIVLDYHPASQPFGLFASLNYVGNTFDNLGGVRTKYGNYAVVDLGARYFLDMDRHHRIDVNLQNVFDKEYATSLTRGFPDDGGPTYVLPNLGLPRTLSVHYTYNF